MSELAQALFQAVAKHGRPGDSRQMAGDAPPIPPQMLAEALANMAKGTGAGLAGMPVDLMTTAMRPFGYDVEQPVGGSDWFGGLMGADTDSGAFMAGQFASPDPMDAARVANYAPELVAAMSTFPGIVKSTKGEPVKAVNEIRKTKESSPVTVYHSTDSDFTEFDPSRGIGGQMWFTNSKEKAAAGYEGARKGRIVEAEIDIRNPAGWEEYDKYGIDELLARGYDGLALKEADGETVYVALFPEQIKIKSNTKVNDR